MVRTPAISHDTFEEILTWLNADRELAVKTYLELRAGLEKIFEWHHCPDPEGLADQVFDRVAPRVHQLRETYDGDPRRYFYGVARNLIKENSVKARNYVPLEEVDGLVIEIVADEANKLAELREECLQTCLAQLDQEKRDLIVSYYAGNKLAKIDHRAEMARQQGVSVETLRVRAYRIRARLENCIEQCLKDKEDNG